MKFLCYRITWFSVAKIVTKYESKLSMQKRMSFWSMEWIWEGSFLRFCLAYSLAVSELSFTLYRMLGYHLTHFAEGKSSLIVHEKCAKNYTSKTHIFEKNAKKKKKNEVTNYLVLCQALPLLWPKVKYMS